MSLATKESIEEHTGAALPAAEKAMSRARAAEREMREHLGDTLYDAIEADGAHEDREDATEAESLLTLYYALPILNVKPEQDGDIIRSTGFDQSRRDKMSRRELQAYRADLYDQAMNALPARATSARDDTTGGAFASVM